MNGSLIPAKKINHINPFSKRLVQISPLIWNDEPDLGQPLRPTEKKNDLAQLKPLRQLIN